MFRGDRVTKWNQKMDTIPEGEPLRVGTYVKILHSNFPRAKIVEYRGPLARIIHTGGKSDGKEHQRLAVSTNDARAGAVRAPPPTPHALLAI